MRGVVREKCGVCASVRCINTSVAMIEPNNGISDRFENVSTTNYLCFFAAN